MPIPPFNTSGVLPPFVGESPTLLAQMAPFEVQFSELVHRFGTTRERWELLRGIHAYRAALLRSGLQAGFQWVDGSFLEDIERSRGRPPADIDVVTFAVMPVGVPSLVFRQRHPELIYARLTKPRFRCDAYVVDLGVGARRPDLLVAQTRYWYGLFSHQRSSYLWKGMLQIDLLSDDDALKGQLETGEAPHAAQT